jgi:hypothetical protein
MAAEHGSSKSHGTSSLFETNMPLSMQTIQYRHRESRHRESRHRESRHRESRHRGRRYREREYSSDAPIHSDGKRGIEKWKPEEEPNIELRGSKYGVGN